LTFYIICSARLSHQPAKFLSPRSWIEPPRAIAAEDDDMVCVVFLTIETPAVCRPSSSLFILSKDGRISFNLSRDGRISFSNLLKQKRIIAARREGYGSRAVDVHSLSGYKRACRARERAITYDCATVSHLSYAGSRRKWCSWTTVCYPLP
jgi:hypothetical protein